MLAQSTAKSKFIKITPENSEYRLLMICNWEYNSLILPYVTFPVLLDKNERWGNIPGSK